MFLLLTGLLALVALLLLLLHREHQARLALATDHREAVTRLDEERKRATERAELIQHTVRVASNDAIKEAQGAFAGVVKPITDSLQRVDNALLTMERTRLTAYAGLTEQLKQLATTHTQLHSETANLTKALRTPHVRGRWGELQLKRVVEMAGMVEYCDFTTQTTVDAVEGRLRPDLLVKLPNSRTVIVDAKAPLQAYLEAVEAPDDIVRIQRLKEHARQLRKHVQALSEKGYWEQFAATPEFVVLFLPGEAFFSAALEQDPSLIEYGVDRKIILATPTTLIALLRSVAYGWREEALAEHAQQISQLGKDLHDRLLTLVDHFQRIKRGLDSTTEAYNKAVGCFEGRVLVVARRFRELKVAEGQAPLEELIPVEKLTREIAAV